MYSSTCDVSTIRRVSEDTLDSGGASALAAGHLAAGASAPDRRARLTTLFHEARACTRCPQLVAGRTQVVFGAGNADAELMFIGEAPGAREDEQGTPFVGASGKLLEELLGAIGLARADVFTTTVLKCRPPGNRDPAPAEIARCRPYLEEQVKLIEPRVVCTLGNFPTKLLRDDPAGIKDLHGRPEIVTIGDRAVYLLPLYHPAAALYTQALLDTLRADMARLPELLARPAPPQPEPVVVEEEHAETPAVDPQPPAPVDDAASASAPLESAGELAPDEPKAADEPRGEDPPQLGLF
jgi:DNA polymerase